MGALEGTSAEPVIGLRADAVARCAQRNCVQIWRFLAEAVIARVRGFASTLALAYFAVLCPNPREIRCVTFRPTLLALRGLAQGLAEHFASKVFAELEVGGMVVALSVGLDYADAPCHSGPIHRTLKARS
jgi:hypothetical protein